VKWPVSHARGSVKQKKNQESSLLEAIKNCFREEGVLFSNVAERVSKIKTKNEPTDLVIYRSLLAFVHAFLV
jgi:hypothetical protein